MSRKCLAIGVSRVEPVDGAAGDFPPLDGAVVAADTIAQWALHSGFAASDVMVLTDKGANRVTDTSLQNAFDQLIPVGTMVDHFVLAFTGHGLTGLNDDTTYWLLSDSLDQGYMIFVEDLKRQLYAYGIKHLTIFSDACRAIANSRGLRDLLPRPGVRKRHQLSAVEVEVARFNACQDATSAFMVKGAAAPGKCIFSGVLAETLWGRVPAAFDGTIIDSSSLGRGLRIAAKKRAAQYNLTLVPSGSAPIERVIYFDQARPPLPPDPDLAPWPPGPSPSHIVRGRQRASKPRADQLEALAAGEVRRKKAEGLRGSLKRAAKPVHDGGAQIVVSGAVKQIWSEMPIVMLNHGPDQAAFVPSGLAEGLLMLDFADGLFAPVWFYPDLVCTVLRDDDGVAAISYRHIYDNMKGTSVAATTIGRLVTGDLSAEEVDNLATQLRYDKHVNPVFGAIAAYCYDVTGDLNSIRRMAAYYGKRLQAAPYDIAFLGMIENDGAMAHVPEVPSDNRRRDGKPPRWLTERTEAGDVRIAGRCPWLRQGWDFLSAPWDAELPLIDGLDHFRVHLTPSVFTTLKEDGGRALAEKWRLQPNLHYPSDLSSTFG